MPTALDLPGPSRRIVVEPIRIPEPDQQPERTAPPEPAPERREAPAEEPVPS
jgi:hypothetical protein